MTDSEDLARDLDERLERLGDELLAARRAGEDLDLPQLAARFDVDEAVVADCLAAVAALETALGEDLPADLGAGGRGLLSAPAGFEIRGELGRGGMGVVYRAHDSSLGRDVALKVLRPGEQMFGDALARFRREAQSLARLRHRHIVTIHAIGEHEGCVYFTMDLVEGRTLAELIRAGEIGVARSVRLLRQVASAIAYAHDQGVVHRDLKPQNILVDGAGDAYVVDFGLARDAAAGVEPGSLRTMTGQLLGTPAYMSPEQALADAARIGEPSDIYALGAVLYECLAGRPPFGDRPLVELLSAIVRDQPTPPRRLNPRVPVAVETICLHAMRKDPARRYPTARAFGEDLERFAEGRPIHAVPPGPVERARLWLGRHGGYVATGLIAAVVAVALFQSLVGPAAWLRGDAQSLRARGDALMASGDWSAAREVYERAAGDPAEADRDTLAKWWSAGTERVLEKVIHGETADPAVAAWSARVRERLAACARPWGADLAWASARFEFVDVGPRGDAGREPPGHREFAYRFGDSALRDRIFAGLESDAPGSRVPELAMLADRILRGDQVCRDRWFELDRATRAELGKSLAFAVTVAGPALRPQLVPPPTHIKQRYRRRGWPAGIAPSYTRTLAALVGDATRPGEQRLRAASWYVAIADLPLLGPVSEQDFPLVAELVALHETALDREPGEQPLDDLVRGVIAAGERHPSRAWIEQAVLRWVTTKEGGIAGDLVRCRPTDAAWRAETRPALRIRAALFATDVVGEPRILWQGERTGSLSRAALDIDVPPEEGPLARVRWRVPGLAWHEPVGGIRGSVRVAVARPSEPGSAAPDPADQPVLRTVVEVGRDSSERNRVGFGVVQSVFVRRSMDRPAEALRVVVCCEPAAVEAWPADVGGWRARCGASFDTLEERAAPGRDRYVARLLIAASYELGEDLPAEAPRALAPELFLVGQALENGLCEPWTWPSGAVERVAAPITGATIDGNIGIRAAVLDALRAGRARHAIAESQRARWSELPARPLPAVQGDRWFARLMLILSVAGVGVWIVVHRLRRRDALIAWFAVAMLACFVQVEVWSIRLPPAGVAEFLAAVVASVAAFRRWPEAPRWSARLPATALFGAAALEFAARFEPHDWTFMAFVLVLVALFAWHALDRARSDWEFRRSRFQRARARYAQ